MTSPAPEPTHSVPDSESVLISEDQWLNGLRRDVGIGPDAFLAGIWAVAENRPYRGRRARPPGRQGSGKTIADNADEADTRGGRASKSRWRI